jgi:8-oxo-dGTP pyrophosphatase MutT (NUDIX family)
MVKTNDHLLWKESFRKKLASCSIFDLYLSRRVAANGQKGEFALVSAPDWVNVVPVIGGEKGGTRFLMVRQYRHGAEAVTTEFPAGLVDHGEEPRAAAARELLEETGRTAGKLTFLGRVSPNPSFMGNWCHTFLAEDLSEPGEKSLDSLELLETVEVSEREVEKSLGTGEYINSLVMVALLWYTLRKAPAA